LLYFNDKSYLADDGLNRSGKMYSECADLIFNQTIEKIKLL